MVSGVPRIGLVVAAASATLAMACPDPAGNDPNAVDRSIPPDTTCPLGDASGCGPAATYANDIAPLVERTCLPCHDRDGVAADRRLSSYLELTDLGTTVMASVRSCTMPPADAGPDAMMTPDDRTELLQWFVCGAAR